MQTFIRKLVRHISTIPAPAGLVHVRAYANIQDDGSITTETEFYPALALQTIVYGRYEFHGEPGRLPPSHGTHKEMLAAGWDFDSEEIDTGALIVDELYGIIHSMDGLLSTPDSEGADLISTDPGYGEAVAELAEGAIMRFKFSRADKASKGMQTTQDSADTPTAAIHTVHA